MSGHNKWSQIKRQKGAEDVKKSQLFSILARAITMEAKRANGDRNVAGLKTAIEKARAENLPNENIERAIKNALGAEANELTEVLYECYGPGGVAIIIEGITDNKNRTAQEIKHLLSEHGTTLATPGAVVWNFEKINNDWRTKNTIALTPNDLQKLNTLFDALNALADVKQIYNNCRR
ncbi:MAG: YebC/PmpR family DNA-binding transcriptional regulator [Patescibacteria group bacterium]